MPKFYFHLRATVPSEDLDGIELADVAAAREEAARFGRELTKVHRALGGHPSSADLLVTNEFGEEILTMSLRALRTGDAPEVALGCLDPEQRYLAEIGDP